MRRSLIALVLASAVVAICIGLARWYATPGSHASLSLYAGYPHNILPCRSTNCPPIRARDGDRSHAVFIAVAGMVADPQTGDLYVVDNAASTIRVIRPTGEVATLAGAEYDGLCILRDGEGSRARFCRPIGITLDQNRRELYVADFANAAVRRVTLRGAVTTLSRTSVSDHRSSHRFTCPLEGSHGLALLCGPTGIAVDQETGDIFVSDSINMVVLSLSQAGHLKVLAGNALECGHANGYGRNASFCRPQGLAFDLHSRSIIVADTNNNRIRSVGLDGRVSTLAGISYPLGPNDVADVANARCRDFNGVGSLAAFCAPFDVAVASSTGEVFVADSANAEIRRIWHTSTSTVAGHYRYTGGFGWDHGGYCYYTKPNALDDICVPTSLATDLGRGVLYFADNVSGQIWKIAL